MKEVERFADMQKPAIKLAKYTELLLKLPKNNNKCHAKKAKDYLGHK